MEMCMSNNRAWIWIGLLLSPSMAHAGAWTLPEGTGLAVVTATASSADRAFVGSAVAATPRYNKIELQGLVEYGFTDRFTAIVTPGLQHIDIAAPTSAQRTGIGYSEFGGRYRLFDGQSWVFSAQA